MNITQAGLPLPDSLWAATATPALETPPLTDTRHVDVAVIGGGFTGLSTALHLAERGVDVCVLEASEPGWGASGRNGGQVNPTVKHDPDDLVRLYGAAAEPLIEMVNHSADDVFGLVEKYRIDCHPVRRGWMQMSYAPQAVQAMHARALQWQRRGVPVEMLDRSGVAARLGTHAFAGGWVDLRAGSVHPLSYVRGLARAATSQGATLHGHTLATGLERREGRWHVQTAAGAEVIADRVVIGTNGYTGPLWPGLEATVIAANSFIVATPPLSGEAARTILADGTTCSTSQRLLLYARRDHQGRLLLGGRGSFATPQSADDYRHLERAMRLLFPAIADIGHTFRWSGRVAITLDHMPHVHEPAPGLTMALGYNGRGVAMATAMGKHLAAHLTEGRAMPLPVTPIRPIPLHFLQRLYITAGVAWYSLLDRFSA